MRKEEGEDTLLILIPCSEGSVIPSITRILNDVERLRIVTSSHSLQFTSPFLPPRSYPLPQLSTLSSRCSRARYKQPTPSVSSRRPSCFNISCLHAVPCLAINAACC